LGIAVWTDKTSDQQKSPALVFEARNHGTGEERIKFPRFVLELFGLLEQRTIELANTGGHLEES
jgi:hypothetical protein